jgi:hypothetical protein
MVNRRLAFEEFSIARNSEVKLPGMRLCASDAPASPSGARQPQQTGPRRLGASEGAKTMMCLADRLNGGAPLPRPPPLPFDHY